MCLHWIMLSALSLRLEISSVHGEVDHLFVGNQFMLGDC